MRHALAITTTCLFALFTAATACDPSLAEDLDVADDDIEALADDEPCGVDVEVADPDLDLVDPSDPQEQICWQYPEIGPEHPYLCGTCTEGPNNGRVTRQWYRFCDICTKACGSWTWVENCGPC